MLDSKPNDPLAVACELVGRYQYHFSKIEHSLNQGVAKVLDLNEGAASIVCANLDFVKKCNIIKSVAALQFTDTTDRLNRLMGRITGLNNPDRQTVIHSTFEPKSEGVEFTRVIAKDGLARTIQVWDQEKFSQSFTNMQQIASELTEVVSRLKPYAPALDFSDSRNSGYIALLFDV